MCHELGTITGLWTREPIIAAFTGMPRTTKNEVNNVQEDLDAVWKARKVSHMCLAEHMMTIRDRYVGRILDTRFEVTRTTLNLGSFDVEMEFDSYDMEMVSPFSFGKDIHDEIGTNKCSTISRSGGDVVEKEKKFATGREDREIIKTS